jgi:hypothetical protein
LTALALAALAACEGEPDQRGGGGPDGGDGSSDSGSDTDDCTPVSWGSGLTVGQPVANWVQTGYIDSDGDFAVEQTEVEFDLVDVNCAGHQAIVLLIGDTT